MSNDDYLFALSFDVDLLGVCACCAIDARIMDAGKHEHLVIGLVAQTASFTYLTHLSQYKIKYKIKIKGFVIFSRDIKKMIRFLALFTWVRTPRIRISKKDEALSLLSMLKSLFSK